MIKTYITLDYELYFGNSGTVENTIIRPTNALLNILNKYNAKAVFFVDVGFILASEKFENLFIEVKKEKEKVINQIKNLVKNGHQIQLHIHPHWEDASFDGKWNFPMQRYRLHSFTENEINEVVSKYKNKLEIISKQKITAFRAGGWCIQPFNELMNAFKNNNINIDSTVFENGKNLNKSYYYKFDKIPQKTSWKFSNNPLIEDPDGFFKEIPISSYKISPIFFWRMVVVKLIGTKKHNNFGDGTPVNKSIIHKLKLLFTYSNSVVSIDGFKAIFLNKSFKKYKNKYGGNFNFVIIGHPKAISIYSLKKLDEFLMKNKNEHEIQVF